MESFSLLDSSLSFDMLLTERLGSHNQRKEWDLGCRCYECLRFKRQSKSKKLAGLYSNKGGANKQRPLPISIAAPSDLYRDP